jgi:hypothetical protein
MGKKGQGDGCGGGTLLGDNTSGGEFVLLPIMFQNFGV